MSLVIKFSVLCIVLMSISLGATILIMGPKLIGPNREFTLVASNVFGETKSDCSLKLQLMGVIVNGNPSWIKLTQTVIVQQDTNKMIIFNVPNFVHPAAFYIRIEGKQPPTSSINNIFEIVHLKSQSFSVSALIQLNKPNFIPSETVKFRMIVLEDNLKLLSRETTVSVYVYDPIRRIMRQWSNVSLDRGILEKQVEIPVIALLGTYEIYIKLTDDYWPSKKFHVWKDELFSRVIDLSIYPAIVPLLEHQALNLTIDVKNDLGKPVRGTVEMELYLSIEDKKPDSTWKWEVYGQRQVYLPFTEKVVRDDAIYDLMLKVTFIEQYTNRTTYKTQRITVYNYKYKVTHDSRLTYHSGLPFKTTLKVTDLNDKPAKNVTLLVEFGSADGLLAQNFTSNMIGDIKLLVHTTVSTKLNYLRVSEGNHVNLNETIYPLESAYEMYIEVKLLTLVKYNRKAKLMVSCSHNMTILVYYVISKGNIVDTGLFRPSQMNRYVFQIVVSARLVPRSRIVVATIVNNKTILGAVDISCNQLTNPLEIKIEENISEDGVDPGDEIELHIRGRPGAFVALTAYDQRLLQHGNNHDVFLADIWNMLDEFHDSDAYPREVLSIAGLFAVAAKKSIIISKRNEYRARGIYPDDPRVSMPGPYRTEFRESWLWQNVTIPPSGRIGLVVTVPHSTSSWHITGVSIDPEYGVGIVNKPIQFSTTKFFFVLDHLPHSIKQDATVSLHFTLFSTISEAFEATVTMYSANNQLQFVDENDEDTGAVAETRDLYVPAKSDAPISFLVKPMKLGELEIRLNASIMQGVISDSFKKIIRIFPEDLVFKGSNRTHIQHKAYLNASYDIPLFIPKKAYNGSIQVDLTLIPDLQASKNIANNFSVSFHYGDMYVKMHINSDSKKNNMTIEPIQPHVAGFDVNVNGVGFGFFEVKWENRVNLMDYTPSFNPNMTKLPTATKLLKQLEVCCSFISENEDDYSNKTLVEVSIPIGYAMDNHSVENTTDNLISSFNILHDGTTLMVYYDSISNEMICFTVLAYRRYRMPVKRPSYIKVQDIDHPELNAMLMFDFYSVRD